MKRPRYVWALAPLVACALVTAFDGCTIVNGLRVPEDAGLDVATVDAGSDADASGCVGARPPPPPPPGPPSGSGLFVSVLRDFNFGLRTDGLNPSLGFNLDGVCTCPAPGSCVAKTVTCDDDQGRDYSAWRLITRAKDATYDLEKTLNDQVTTGGPSILVFVQDYNGMADDPEVTVAALASPGLFDAAGTTKLTPTFTASDAWSVSDTQVVVYQGTTLPKPSSLVRGYVKDRTLVAETPLTLRFNTNVRMVLSQALIVAKITEVDGGGFALGEGTVAGRWPTRDAIESLGSIAIAGTPICDTPALLDEVRATICGAADLSADPAAAGDRPCDAVSAAMTMRGVPASLGPPRTVVDTVTCSDAGLECP
ncbi:MAG: hypothetical protein KC657_09770 [Myxococcales bacterium]|nr:hypothetical protein [Myxococcales bacterium]